MKYLSIITLSLALLFVACGGGEEASSKDDNEIQRIKKALAEKKATFKTLEKEIKALEQELAVLVPPKEDARTLVTTEKIGRKDFSRYIEIQGSVQSNNVFFTSSEAGGRLLGFTLKEGDRVTKGQLIGRVDMEAVDKQITEIETALELAKTTYERQKRLWEQNIGSEIQYLQAKNQKERLEKSIESVRFQLTKSKIYATATGEITRTMVKSGDVIAPGMPLIEVLNLSRVQVQAEVPETYLKSVKKGQTVKVKFPALEQETSAKITLIGQQVNPANRTFKVEIDMANSGNLKPNLLATVSLKDFEQKNAVVLPSELIQQEVSGKSYVFVQDEGEKGTIAKKVYVTIGETYEGETYISEGLTGDEIFIIKGARDLKDGELIEVK
jgi:membrane fusion protein, multidrug efflux system